MARWLDRALLIGPRVAFVASPAQFKAAKRRAGVQCDGPWLEPGWHGCTHAYADSAGQLVCIVAIDLQAAQQMDPIDVAALLAHEAVHVWQRTAAFIGGESELGREMPAYAIQNISAQLMRAYVAATSSLACSRPA
jgi:hypothetical protein